jgi:hypothetical protein
VLAYRKLTKQISTYGDNFSKFWSGGRLRPRYKQTQTATGRLASDKPNGQNLVGRLKDFIKALEGRRLIACDYSQAELRGLADMAAEPAMLIPFREGKDLHDETALQVFGVVMSDLKKSDPSAAKKLRTKVKGVNFGIPYGMAGAALARRLTNQGVPTTVQEASATIKQIMEARPKMAAWLKERDNFVDSFSKNPGPVDYGASFKLLDLWQRFESKRRSMKKQMRRLPSAAELVEASISPQLSLFEPEMDPAEREQLIADVDWAFRYDAPVLLRPPVFMADGRAIYEPVAFESRTVSGRRRIFAVVMDSGYQRSDDDTGGGGKKTDMFNGFVTHAALKLATTNKPFGSKVRDEWADKHDLALPRGMNRGPAPTGNRNADADARRTFDNEERTRVVNLFKGDKRALKTQFVLDMFDALNDAYGADAVQGFLATATQSAISALGPAFRNHPIQGGVSDIAASAFAKLMLLCDEYPDLIWVQTVHDSIVGECDAANAVEIAIRQRALMEDAMLELFPNVPAKVDADICIHLGEGSIEEGGGCERSITDEEVEEYRRSLAAVAVAA